MSQIFGRILLLGGSLVAGAFSLCAVYNYWKKRQFKSIDEGFEDVSRIEESTVKKVLVLGMPGAGKTTIFKQLTDTKDCSKLAAQAGFKVATMERDGVTFNIWEVGDGANFKPYFSNFLEGTDLLMYVVDSGDMHALSLAVMEVAGMLTDPRLARVPVVLVANKQDLPSALPPNEVARVLDIWRSKRSVLVVGTSSPPGAPLRHASLAELEQVLLSLSSG